MTLNNFLKKMTHGMELCAICVNGWIVATCYIDYEDLFVIPEEFRNKKVIYDEWSTLNIINKYGNKEEVACHYIYIK